MQNNKVKYVTGQQVMYFDGGHMRNGQPVPNTGDWYPAKILGQMTSGPYVGEYEIEYVDFDNDTQNVVTGTNRLKVLA